jgi:hypothetical protein
MADPWVSNQTHSALLYITLAQRQIEKKNAFDIPNVLLLISPFSFNT